MSTTPSSLDAQPSPLDARVSLYTATDENATVAAKTPTRSVSLRQVLDAQRTPESKTAKAVAALRAAIAAGDPEAEKKKLSLPAVTLSGESIKRGDAGMVNHSGVVQMDFDAKDNARLEAEGAAAVRDSLKGDPYILAAYISPRGAGVKAWCRVPVSPDLHDAAFASAAAHMLEHHGLTADGQCKAPSHLCFLSHDADLWVNEHAEPLPVPSTPMQESPAPVPADSGERTQAPRSPDVTSADVVEALSSIRYRPDYSEWLRIASAVFSQLDKPDALEVLNAWRPEEKPGEYEEKYRRRLRKVGVGTLFMLARKHGYTPPPRIPAEWFEPLADDDAADDAPPPFPYAAFTGPAGAFADEIRRARPVPPELPYLAALACVGALAGKGVEASDPHKGLRTRANLFIVAAASTGRGKSVSCKPFASILRELEKGARKRFSDAVTKARRERRDLEELMKRKPGKSKPGKEGVNPPVPELDPLEDGAGDWGASVSNEERHDALTTLIESRPPAWVCTEPTIEGLKADMTTWGECGFVCSAEAGGFIAAAGGVKTDRRDMFSDLCGLYSGDAVGDSRKTKGESVRIGDPCLSVFLAAQLPIVNEIRSERARTVGILSRGIFAVPSPAPIPDPEEPTAPVSEGVREAFAVWAGRVFAAYCDPERTEKGTHSVTLEPAAALYVARLNHRTLAAIDARELDGEEGVRRAENTVRVALCLHLMRYGTEAPAHPLPLSTVQDAEAVLAWCSYPWEGMHREQQREEDARQLEKMQGHKSAGAGGLLAEEVKRCLGWHKAGPGSGERTRAFLGRMVKAGKLREVPPVTGERKPRYALAKMK